MNRLLSFFPVLLMLAALVVPSPALAAPNTVDCAVGFVGGPQTVVLTFGSAESRANIADAGSFCTDLANDPNWVGADKFRNWERLGYQRLCHVTFTNNESAEVHVWSDFDSREMGYRLCLMGDQREVYYF